ncbi:MAG: ABC transporter permease [Candidatus Pristimantibacillus sp.]
MIGQALSSDFLKIRRKGLWFLAILGPVGLLAMQALNFGLRYDYLTKQYADDLWGGLLDNLLGFVPIALFLGITLVCSLLANVEHGTSSWKQLLALPISRTTVFAAKFALSAILIAFSCLLLAIGTVVLGLLLKFGWDDIPVLAILRISFFPYFAAFPGLALLLWLCMTVKNQALPITLGVLISVFTIVPLTEWLPISWPLLGYAGPHQEIFVGAGLGCGLIIFILGAFHFNRKDVN